MEDLKQMRGKDRDCFSFPFNFCTQESHKAKWGLCYWVFSSQQDYKMLYEVSVCFMPASNGKWGLQPSLQRLITAPLSKDKWVCASRSFLKDSCGKMRLHFIYFNNQALHWIVTRLSHSLFSEFELAWPFLLTNKSYVRTASRIHSCVITVKEWITHSLDELSWFMCGMV